MALASSRRSCVRYSVATSEMRAHLRGFAIFFSGEIFFEGFLFQTANASEEIDFVGRADVEVISREGGATVES